MIIYLDLCCFNRPYDDQSFLSIYIETQAKLGIQDLIEEENSIYLIWSFIMDYENASNPDSFVSREISYWRNKASIIVNKNEEIIKQAENFFAVGLGKKDSLHIASAIDAGAGFFITVDKGIINKKDRVTALRICSPVDFISIIEEEKYEK